MYTDLLPLPVVPLHSVHLLQVLLYPASLDAGQLTMPMCLVWVLSSMNDCHPIVSANSVCSRLWVDAMKNCL